MGKKKRDQLLMQNKINFLDFLPSLLYSGRPLVSNQGFKAIPRLNTDDFYVLFLDREKELQAHLKMNSNEIFVDVGANVGYYSLLVSKGNPGIKIISIEAHPDNFVALNKNIEINNFKNIVSLNKAVSIQTGSKIRLYEYVNKKGKKDCGLCDVSNRYNSTSFIEVDCDSMDNILKSMAKGPYVIKIDIEGEEVNALLGAKNTLKNTRKIIVEIHNDANLEEARQILLSHQFNIEIVKGNMPYMIGTKD